MDKMQKMDLLEYGRNNKKASHQQAVWQNGGFGAFLETFVFIESLGIFSIFGAENLNFL